MNVNNKMRYTNRTSSNQGRMFENLIQMGCSHYRMNGHAEVEKTPEPFIVTKLLEKNSFTGRFIGKAQPDFQGTINGGQSIIFEAKCTSKDKILQNVITEKQAEYLESHFKLGAITEVCVNIGKTYAFIPWEIWSNMRDIFGRKYLLEQEIKKYAVKTPGMVLFLNYLDKEMQCG